MLSLQASEMLSEAVQRIASLIDKVVGLMHTCACIHMHSMSTVFIYIVDWYVIVCRLILRSLLSTHDSVSRPILTVN